MTILSAAFTANQLGDNVIIEGNATTPTIQIIELVFQVSAATTLIFKAGTNPLTGQMIFATGGGINLPNNGQGPHLECDGGSNFVVNVGLLASVGGFVIYDQF